MSRAAAIWSVKVAGRDSPLRGSDTTAAPPALCT